MNIDLEEILQKPNIGEIIIRCDIKKLVLNSIYSCNYEFMDKIIRLSFKINKYDENQLILNIIITYLTDVEDNDIPIIRNIIELLMSIGIKPNVYALSTSNLKLRRNFKKICNMQDLTIDDLYRLLYENNIYKSHITNELLINPALRKEINTTFWEGERLLYMASINGNDILVDAILDVNNLILDGTEKIDINIKNIDGSSILHGAALGNDKIAKDTCENRYNIIKKYVLSIDKTIQNTNGETAFDLVKCSNQVTYTKMKLILSTQR